MKRFSLSFLLLFFLHTTQAQMATTFAGGSNGYLDATGSTAKFRDIFGICVNSAGTLYVVDNGNHRIRKITPEGEVSTFVGSDTAGHADGVGTAAQFDYIRGICVDAAGTLYVTEYYRVRKITPEGVVTTLAGGENQGYVDGPGSSAQFFGLMGICVDAAGTIYVADSSNNRIRKITPAGVVSTLVDGTSLFISIHDLCINNATGMLFVTDRYAHKIYKVTPTGAISTFAGSGVMGYQEGTGTNAKFSFPYCLCIDASGNLYVTDNTYLIRKITPAGVVTTLAGGPGGDQDGIGTAARFGNLEGICVNTQGTQYVVDIQHRKIRKISNSLGVDDAARLDGIKLYPNPVKGILNVELEGFGGGLVSVVDLGGKVVYSGAVQNPVTTIDTSTLAKGVYFARVTDGDKTATEKFVVE